MKENMLRAARDNGQVTLKGKPIRLAVDLPEEESAGQYSTSLKNFQPRISYPAKLSFISKAEIKSFMDKQLLRDFITTRPALQNLLKEAIKMERNN